MYLILTPGTKFQYLLFNKKKCGSELFAVKLGASEGLIARVAMEALFSFIFFSKNKANKVYLLLMRNAIIAFRLTLNFWKTHGTGKLFKIINQ